MRNISKSLPTCSLDPLVRRHASSAQRTCHSWIIIEPIPSRPSQNLNKTCPMQPLLEARRPTSDPSPRIICSNCKLVSIGYQICSNLYYREFLRAREAADCNFQAAAANNEEYCADHSSVPLIERTSYPTVTGFSELERTTILCRPISISQHAQTFVTDHPS